ncbi:hypothetical protein K505DRAFT_334595 [Melanomma pulvis-pyrius CBS 109.77]|uniref:Uncharacterized protein n=1 Tax=Melanomma pulvis-pyrius CBS 109.77 TaxID=1314802 RepID=A0A6A6XLR5_9PLEO|nr:hypothetical protein K505DRAFT_334595 [Melanomma pulvis-pyrius CBS 109.77]
MAPKTPQIFINLTTTDDNTTLHWSHSQSLVKYRLQGYTHYLHNNELQLPAIPSTAHTNLKHWLENGIFNFPSGDQALVTEAQFRILGQLYTWGFENGEDALCDDIDARIKREAGAWVKDTDFKALMDALPKNSMLKREMNWRRNDPREFARYA